LTGIELIVGLGNPGSEYEKTRHNAGFWLVEALAHQQNQVFRKENKFSGSACKIKAQGKECWLLKPQTFMNRSGQAVAALALYYKIPRQNILVIHDELDLSPGTARFKQSGGHGGHNGLRSLIASLGGNDFSRMRIGIGHPGHSSEVSRYVLHEASKIDMQSIESAILDALDVMPLAIQGQYQKLMNQLHTNKQQ